MSPDDRYEVCDECSFFARNILTVIIHSGLELSAVPLSQTDIFEFIAEEFVYLEDSLHEKAIYIHRVK